MQYGPRHKSQKSTQNQHKSHLLRNERQAHRNNLKNRDFNKEAPQNYDSERATIAGRQGASENHNSEVKPTPVKTDSSGCFGIRHVFSK